MTINPIILTSQDLTRSPVGSLLTLSEPGTDLTGSDGRRRCPSNVEDARSIRRNDSSSECAATCETSFIAEFSDSNIYEGGRFGIHSGFYAK